MEIQARFEPQPFMHLPAILNCNKLTIRNLDHSVSVNDVVEWLEREKPGQWSEPSYLEVPFDKIIGGFAGLIDALKKVGSVWSLRQFHATNRMPEFTKHFLLKYLIGFHNKRSLGFPGCRPS